MTPARTPPPLALVVPFHNEERYLPTLIASYHPSRQNTQTGKLSRAMLAAVFARARRCLDGDARRARAQ